MNGTHRPDWVITNETDEQFCVQPGDVQTQPISYMMKFYANQFYSPCNRMHKRIMWGSGWSASFWHVQCGLVQALKYNVPLFMEGYNHEPWIYTANPGDWTNLTCPAGIFTCYFLPYHRCETMWNISEYYSMLTLDSNVEVWEGEDEFSGAGIYDDAGWSAYVFSTRKQLWLRRAVYDYKQEFKRTKSIGAGQDCTVIHVRRGDLVYEGQRPCFPVVDYVNMIPQERLNLPNHYLLLLTDDSEVVDEAHEFFPDLNWKYVDKSRFNSTSWGWQNFSPSRNPALEVIILLSEFELATECSAFVHGPSGFSKYIQRHMLSVNSSIEVFNVQDGNSPIKQMPVKVDGVVMIATNLANVLTELRNNRTKLE